VDKSLASSEIQNYLRQHEHDDERQLVLRQREILGVPAAQIAEQLAGRRKARIKVPEYYHAQGIIYPPGINFEQASSGQTAKLKSTLLRQSIPSQKSLVDLTGGFGIDSYYLSKVFQEVIYVEPNESLLDVARHNHEVLRASNIHYHPDSAENFIQTFQNKIDCVFIDPSRRKSDSRKVFRLQDCEPDITSLAKQIFERTDHLMIKTSPLLDIQQGLRELDHVERVYVVAIDNECKEVLFLLNSAFAGEPSITGIHVRHDQEEKFSFLLSDESNITPTFGDIQEYLYEPNAALMKAGAFKILSSQFSMDKLHPSTHVYTTDRLVPDFPGRIFQTLSIVPSDPKVMRKIFPDGKVNIITRNYPLRPEELQKKLQLKDGGDQYLLAFTSREGKRIVHATRIK
jgi:predicted O-methyltransferase YrrM